MIQAIIFIIFIQKQLLKLLKTITQRSEQNVIKRIGQQVPLRISGWIFANAYVTETKLFNKLGLDLSLATEDIARILFREVDKW